MKNINNINSLKNILTLAALVIANFASATTYTAINSGKWSDAATWENGTPGNEIKADDVVIIKNHITMNTDVAVNGTLTIEKGVSVMSNKSLHIATGGKLVNNGNLTVKRIINEGTISNNAMIESMNDMENKGIINNDQNIMAGSNILNFGGNMTGTKGTYFANGNVITSKDAKFGNTVKIYSNPDQTTASISLETAVAYNYGETAKK